MLTTSSFTVIYRTRARSLTIFLHYCTMRTHTMGKIFQRLFIVHAHNEVNIITAKIGVGLWIRIRSRLRMGLGLNFGLRS